jgi:protein-S-isoprenylcysteine O-methyltransferase Ste14
VECLGAVLPAGNLTALTRAASRRPVADLIGALTFLALAAVTVIRAPVLTPILAPAVVYDVAAAFAFLGRERPRRTVEGMLPRVLAHLGTFGMPTFVAAAALWRPEWVAVATPFWARSVGVLAGLVSTMLAGWGLWHLRRSFSIEPAARGLVTSGPYRVARHPLYAAYALAYAGGLLQMQTPAYAIGCAVLALVMWGRIRYEEGILTAAYPVEYPAYRAQVGALGPRFWRWRPRAAANPA